jgi:hypothetical protein
MPGSEPTQSAASRALGAAVSVVGGGRAQFLGRADGSAVKLQDAIFLVTARAYENV